MKLKNLRGIVNNLNSTLSAHIIHNQILSYFSTLEIDIINKSYKEKSRLDKVVYEDSVKDTIIYAQSFLRKELELNKIDDKLIESAEFHLNYINDEYIGYSIIRTKEKEYISKNEKIIGYSFL